MSHGVFIAAGEYRPGLRRMQRMLQSHPNGWARLAGRAATYGIDHHHDRTVFRRDQPVDVGGSSCFLHSVAGQIGSHWSDELFRITHASILTSVLFFDSRKARKVGKGAKKTA